MFFVKNTNVIIVHYSTLKECRLYLCYFHLLKQALAYSQFRLCMCSQSPRQASKKGNTHFLRDMAVLTISRCWEYDVFIFYIELHFILCFVMFRLCLSETFILLQL